MAALQERLREMRLYLVCGDIPASSLDAALSGGVDIVQLRMKHASKARILSAAHRIRALCRRHGALFLLNDLPELVVAAGADGVHVGQADLPVAQARELVGTDRLVGLSTHTPAQIDAAAEADVDYIGVGPVHATPTKPGRPAVGTELVTYAAEHAVVPFFAIGGIEPANVAAVRAAGASRVAVVRALTDAAAPEAVARDLRAQLERETEETRVGAAQS